MRSHAAAAVQLWIDAGEPRAPELVAAILADPSSADIPDKDRLLYATVELWTVRRSELDQRATNALLALGWEAAELFEASSVVALFCFYNAWVDNNGVPDMAPESYAGSGQRLARGGYV